MHADTEHGVDDQAAIRDTVESLTRLGYPELIVRPDNEPATKTCRDAVSKDLNERCGIRAILQICASVGMVDH